ncbi:MAG: hypothetical protein GQ564_08560 [Bacteroidales bacterium]|nr:hypothetical protein [Bacteroidales bacterium]
MDWISIISFFVAIISTGLSIFFYLRPRLRKKIDINSNASISIIEIKEQIDDLKITYKGKEIENLHVLRFRIENKGSKDFTNEDFIDPFHCTIMGNIVNVTKVNSHPYNCDLDINKIENNKIYFKTNLFKAGEYVDIKVILLSKPSLNFNTNRIKDLKEISVTKNESANKFKYFKGGLVASIFLSISFLIANDIINPSKQLLINLSYIERQFSIIGESDSDKYKSHISTNIVTISNIGSKAIKTEDFDGNFEFKSNDSILYFDFSEEIFDNLIATTLTGDRRNFHFSKFELLPKTSISFLIKTSKPSKLNINCKLKDGKVRFNNN